MTKTEEVQYQDGMVAACDKVTAFVWIIYSYIIG